MLAYHPITGKEIRILQTEASLSRTRRTLQMISAPRQTLFDTISGSAAACPTYLMCLSEFDVDAARAAKLCVVSQKALTKFTPDVFKGFGLTNVLVLEEIHLLYPHLGRAWDGTGAGAASLLADLLHYDRVVAEEEKAAPLLWVTQFYSPSVSKRRREIQRCLVMNSASPLVSRVVLLNEKQEDLPEGCKREKIEQRVIGKRLTYADVMRFAAEVGRENPETLIAFANADIAIDSESWRALWSVSLENTCLALLRYDVPESGSVADAVLFGPRPDSQDTWVIRAGDIAARESGANAFGAFEFRFGQMGCDNAFALEMLRKKFLVVNPCFTLRTWHFHASDVRTYDKTDVLERGFFHYVHPSGFQDVQPLLARPAGAVAVTPAGLARPVRGPGAATWMSQINRELPVGVEPFTMGSGTNPWTPAGSEILVKGMKDVFMTPDGLVMDRKQLYVGPAARAQKVWAEARLQSMAPSVEVKNVLFAPWPRGAETSREIYVLKFLSKILRLSGSVAGSGEFAAGEAGRLTKPVANAAGEFYCPDAKPVLEALHCFRWPGGKQPVIKHERDAQVWCREASGFLVGDVEEIVSEDVAALRAAVQGWIPTPQKFAGLNRLVIVEDGEVLTTEFVRQLEDVLERCFDVRVIYPGRTSADRMLDVMRGAWGVLVAGGDLARVGWNWILPEGAFVFEVVGTAKATQDGLNLSAAAGLEHRFVRRVREEILESIVEEEKAWTAAGGGAEADDQRPTIWLPRSDLEGYFSHPGDSFREMVRLWAAAGLVRAREHPTATMVWWGSVGGPDGVLLYDRPNHDWRLAAPMPERSWKFALFGNPKPPASASAPASPWFFWPRRPVLVDELVAAGVAGTPYESRTAGLVFYGKVENKVQEKRRLGGAADWSKACAGSAEDFVLIRDPSEKYPFTQKQYLEKLAAARFGLCLAGYGFKCHREVECMAMGCVPVCAPEVDMDSYAEPLVEGVHYLRVKSPEEAAAAVASVSKEKWEEMSEAGRAWWARNASCEGSFKLTQRLIEVACTK